MKRRAQAAIAALVIMSVDGGALAADVAVTYSLSPESDDGVMARGRIVLQLSNISGQALDDVSVRAVLPGGGQLSGAVLDAVDVAQGEVVVLHGEYVMAQEVSGPDQVLPWSVTYRGADGAAHTASIAVVRQD
jgi:hypothetical protein